MDPFTGAAIYFMITAAFYGGMAIGKNQEQIDRKLQEIKDKK